MIKKFDGYPSLEEVLDDVKKNQGVTLKTMRKSRLEKLFKEKVSMRSKKAYAEYYNLNYQTLINVLLGLYDEDYPLMEEKRVLKRLERDGVF